MPQATESAILSAMPQLESVSAAAPRRLTFVFAGLAILGAFGTWTGVRLLLTEGSGPKTFVGPLLTGVVLLVVGTVMPVVLSRARAARQARERLRAAHPGQPWAWREDWVSGRIAGGGAAAAAGLWLFATFWTGFTSLAAWLFHTDRPGEAAVYVALIFPAIGVLLLGLAAKTTLQRRRYGRSYFVLQTNPAVIGRALEGYVETAIAGDAPAGGVEVRLASVRRTTSGTSKNRTTSEHTLWQDHVTVPPLELARGFTGLRIPVAFAIPTGVRAYDDRDPGDQVVWRLSVAAAMSGVDYADSFDVPVFDTGAPPLTDEERTRLTRGREARARAYVPEHPIMRTGATPGGGTMFFFKPRVTLRAGIGMVAATAASWAGTWYLFTRGVPVAPYVVAFVALLFTAGTVVSLFHRSSVTVEGGEVVIRHRILGLGPTRRLRPDDITRVYSEVVGEGNAQSWEVKVQASTGASHGAAAHLPTQLEADWTAQQLRAAIDGVRVRAR